MVGFNPDVVKTLTVYDVAISGIFSGLVTRFLLQPLDVIKIRFQVQLEPITRGGGKYKGMLSAFTSVCREENFFALWKGHVAAQCLSVAYAASQFTTFELLTEKAWDVLPKEYLKEHKPLLNFVCGAVAGNAGMLTAMPFDVLRTRFVCQGEPKVYRNMLHATRLMYTHEGPQSFFKGLMPSLLQITPYAGLQFTFYLSLCAKLNIFPSPEEESSPGIFSSMLCGMMSGLLAKTAVYPLDLIKKRLQVQGFEQARIQFGRVQVFTGIIDCATKTVKREGFRGLYKGLVPSSLKAAISTGCNFSVYEQTLQFLRYLAAELDTKD